MTVTNKFKLLGHGNGWPSRGFIMDSAPVSVVGTDAILPASITSNSLNMGDVISVRPYVEPSAANGYDATGFLKFRTLGGYSDADSGKPTEGQLDLSLANAMKFFYNAELGGSSSSTGSVTYFDAASGSNITKNVSASVSPSVLENKLIFGGPFTGEVLSPKERVISFIKELNPDGSRRHNVRSNALFGNQDIDTFDLSDPGVITSATSGRYQVTIVRLFDTTDTTDPVFLGYGLQSHQVSIGGGDVGGGVVGTATSSIGSYFNPNSTIFNPDVDPSIVVEFDISNTNVSNMPLLTMNESFTGDGASGNSTSSSATSSGATFSLDSGQVTGSSSIYPSYQFYTY